MAKGIQVHTNSGSILEYGAVDKRRGTRDWNGVWQGRHTDQMFGNVAFSQRANSRFVEIDTAIKDAVGMYENDVRSRISLSVGYGQEWIQDRSIKRWARGIARHVFDEVRRRSDGIDGHDSRIGDRGQTDGHVVIA